MGASQAPETPHCVLGLNATIPNTCASSPPHMQLIRQEPVLPSVTNPLLLIASRATVICALLRTNLEFAIAPKKDDRATRNVSSLGNIIALTAYQPFYNRVQEEYPVHVGG